MKTTRFFFILAVFFIQSIAPLQAATGRKAMVVTADAHATAAALEILERGGNAVDAAVAAQWVLNVVEPGSSGIGGGGFFLYYDAATKRILAFDGREKAPAEVFPEMFLDETGEPYPFKPERITGGLAVGVPGTLKLLKEVHDRYGTRQFSFASLFDPAIRLAEQGFPVTPRLAKYMEEEKGRLGMFEASRRIFLDENGNGIRAGQILRQQDLGATFRLIQKKGPKVFYEGEIAADIVKAVQKAPFHPGFMKRSDLKEYRVAVRQAVRGSYRGHDIFSMGPPSSGGTTFIEILHILEPYNIRTLGTRVDGYHLLSEAQKVAFQDRNRYLGDPEFSKIPLKRILSKQFAKERSDGIHFSMAIPTSQAAVRPLALEGTHTSHMSIVDAWGNAVAYTTTIEEIFGSGMVVPGRGFILNNELTDFDAVPRDFEGKLMPNAPEGDKRPRSSMTPTFVFRRGKLVMVLGSPGGSKIIGAVLNVFIHAVDFGMPIEQAVAAPRMINRDGPIEMEPLLFNNADLRRELERRGHPLIPSEPFGNVQAIQIDPEEGILTGAGDPRGEGSAQGY